MSTAAVIVPAPAPVHHSFFSNLLHEIESIGRKSPTWIEAANAVLQIGIPLVRAGFDLNFPVLAPVVDPVLSRITVGMATLSLMAKQGGSHPSLLSTLQALQANLADLEAVANVSDPAMQAKIAANIDLLTSELAAVEALVPAAASAPAS